MIIRSLHEFSLYYGDTYKVECPTGSGRCSTLDEVARDIARRLVATSSSATRPAAGGGPSGATTSTSRPIRTGATTCRSLEYFNGDTGAGLGASHQTGWTALVVSLLLEYWDEHGACLRSPPGARIPIGATVDARRRELLRVLASTPRAVELLLFDRAGGRAAAAAIQLDPQRTAPIDYWHVVRRRHRRRPALRLPRVRARPKPAAGLRFDPAEAARRSLRAGRSPTPRTTTGEGGGARATTRRAPSRAWSSIRTPTTGKATRRSTGPSSIR